MPHFNVKKLCRNLSDEELKLNGILQVFDVSGTLQTQTTQGTIFDNELLIVCDTSYSVTYQNAATGDVHVQTNGAAEIKLYHPQSFICHEQPTGPPYTLLENGTHALVISAAGTVGQIGTIAPPAYVLPGGGVIYEPYEDYDITPDGDYVGETDLDKAVGWSGPATVLHTEGRQFVAEDTLSTYTNDQSMNGAGGGQGWPANWESFTD